MFQAMLIGTLHGVSLYYAVRTGLVLYARTVAVGMLNKQLTNSRRGAIVHLYLTSSQFALSNGPDLDVVQMMTECRRTFVEAPERNLYIMKLGE
jgi:hypothetical protein